MRCSIPFAAMLMLLGSAIGLFGCQTSHASPFTSRSSPDSSPTKPASAPAPALNAMLQFKRPPRNSEFTTYHNPDYGVSFKYPRNYFLDELPGADNPYYQEAVQHLGAEQPGATLVAVVSIPRDTYPNTTFVGATLQFVINPVVSSPVCHSFAVPLDEAYSSGYLTIQGINFDWRERGSAAAGTGYLNRNYSGFLDNACYEFFLEVVQGSNPDADPQIKDADVRKIMRVLEKIVSSLQVVPQPAPANSSSLPAIRSFSVEPLSESRFTGVVRVSWETSGARQNEVFLRVNCPSFAQLNPLPDIDSSSQDAPPDPYTRASYYRLESIFSCGAFTPVPAPSGSFRLQVENGPVSFTLFVFHLNYLTKPSNI